MKDKNFNMQKVKLNALKLTRKLFELDDYRYIPPEKLRNIAYRRLLKYAKKTGKTGYAGLVY